MKAQSSMEYLIIVGFTVFLAIGMLAIFNFYSRQVNDTVNLNQLDRLAKDIIDSSESMFYHGPPSKTTIKANMPAGVNSITIGPNEISFNVKSGSGPTDINYQSSVPLSGQISLTVGLKFIEIEAKEGLVWVNGT